MMEYIDKDDLYAGICKRVNNPGIRSWLGAIIAEIPSADVAQMAYWKPVYESKITGFDPNLASRDPIGGYECSNCKKEAVFDCNDQFVLSDYCPNCGAKMEW